MVAPLSALSTQRPDLAGSLEEFDLEMNQAGFIASRVFPVITVGKQAGVFGRIPIEELLKNPETARNVGSAYNRISGRFTVETYACQENGIEEPIDDREATMYADYLDAELIATRRARDIIMRAQEARVAAQVFNTTVYTGAALFTDLTANPWSTAATDAIAQVNAAVQKVWENSGIWPNAIIMNRLAFRHLRNNTSIKNAISSSGAGDSVLQGRITQAQIAQAFDLDFVLVAGGTNNSAADGDPFVAAQIWGNEAMVCKVATTNDHREPAIGRTFHWAADGSTMNGTVETYREEKIRGNVIRVRHDTHEKRLYTELGHLLGNVYA